MRASRLPVATVLAALLVTPSLLPTHRRVRCFEFAYDRAQRTQP